MLNPSELPDWAKNLMATCPVCERKARVTDINELYGPEPWGFAECSCGARMFVDPWALKGSEKVEKNS